MKPWWSALPRRLKLGVATFVVLVVVCTVAPWVYHYEDVVDPARASLLPPGIRVQVIQLKDGATIVAPDAEVLPDRITVRGPARTLEIDDEDVDSTHTRRFWLGTDRYGRDLLGQLFVGGRISIAVAVLALLVALAVGLVVGLAAATAGGAIDALLMRIVDGLLAFPVVFLLILASSLFRPGPVLLIFLLGLTSWMSLARLIRGQVLSLRSRKFVMAARACGTPSHRIWLLHLIPNMVGPLSQDLALRSAGLVIAEATLSYLGLGISPSIPSWGNLISQGHQSLPDGWWLATFPGFTIAILVFALAVIGDGLQQLQNEATSSELEQNLVA
jgi:peptide/nickel transport system permease protein